MIIITLTDTNTMLLLFHICFCCCLVEGDINPLNADCVYLRACAPVSQRGMRIYTQLRSGGLVRMSIAIEEAPDNHRRQIHP